MKFGVLKGELFKQRCLLGVVYFFVFLSGMCALVYEVLWQRYLSRIMGADSTATAVILSVFLGGLSVGYYICGRLTTLVKNYLKGYALLEAIIGGWGLLFPYIFNGVDSLSSSWRFAPVPIMIFQGMFCGVALTLVPTVCMGGTIPFLTRALSPSVELSTRVHARLYSINTLGAFAGTVAAGFYLIEKFGLPLSVMSAGIVNIAVACVFYLIGSGRKEVSSIVKSRTSTQLPDAENIGSSSVTLRVGSMYRPVVLYFVAFLSGLYVMVLENVMIRVSNLSFGSSSYSFSMIVAVFIFFIALGSYVVSSIRKLPPQALFYNQLFIMLCLFIVYMLADDLPYFAHLVRITFQSNIVGFILYYCAIFILLSLCLFIPVSLMGATVPICFHEIKRELSMVGFHSGFLFSLNTIGSLIGSIVGGIVLFVFTGVETIFAFAIALTALSVLLTSVGRPHAVAGAVAVAVCVIFTIILPSFDKTHFVMGTFRKRAVLPYTFDGPDVFFKKFLGGKKILFYDDDPTATVAVIENRPDPAVGRRARAIVVNGKSDSSTIADIYTLKLSAHIPALFARSRENVMVIGLGTGVTAGEISLYPDVKTIDVAEISPAVIHALKYFSHYTFRVEKDRRLHIHHGDAFRILRRSNKKWDIIISEPSNPWVTGVDLLFTEEFYRLVREHLKPDGIFLQWMQAYSASSSLVGMVANTVSRQFKFCRVFIGSSYDLLIMATQRDITLEDIVRAENVFKRLDRVSSSVDIIRVKNIDNILIREIWSPSFVRERFRRFGLQTMDNPRLHYLAGRDFFMGRKVPYEFLLPSATAPYFNEYLLVKKHGNWLNFTFTKDYYDSLLLSSKDILYGTYLPVADSIRLRAYIQSNELFPLSWQEKERFGISLLPFIVTPRKSSDWVKLNLDIIPPRSRAVMLFDTVEKTRSWFFPYPVSGLRNFLWDNCSGGSSTSAVDRNWFCVRLAVLMMEEGDSAEAVRKVMENLVVDSSGRPILDEATARLINRIPASIFSPPTRSGS